MPPAATTGARAILLPSGYESRPYTAVAEPGSSFCAANPAQKCCDRARPSGCGPIATDHSARSSTSFNVTVMTPEAPSISTRPKNCNPKHGARFSPCSALQPFAYSKVGPNVLSSWPGPQVPACSGPETNSQNGSKSENTARFGS